MIKKILIGTILIVWSAAMGQAALILEDKVSWGVPDNTIEVRDVEQTFISHFPDLTRIKLVGKARSDLYFKLKRGAAIVRTARLQKDSPIDISFMPIPDSKNARYSIVLNSRVPMQLAVVNKKIDDNQVESNLAINGKRIDRDLFYFTFDEVDLSPRQVLVGFLGRLMKDKPFFGVYVVLLLGVLGQIIYRSMKMENKGDKNERE